MTTIISESNNRDANRNVFSEEKIIEVLHSEAMLTNDDISIDFISDVFFLDT